MLVVSGQSGCGKSSFVRAGIAAELAADPAWLVAVPFTPGTHPISAVVSALTASEVEMLLSGENGLSEVARRLLGTRSRLLLIIDQAPLLLESAKADCGQKG